MRRRFNESSSSRDNVAKHVREVKEYLLASHVPNPLRAQLRTSARTFPAENVEARSHTASGLAPPASFSYIYGARFHSAQTQSSDARTRALSNARTRVFPSASLYDFAPPV
jgi:hypothetical protein